MSVSESKWELMGQDWKIKGEKFCRNQTEIPNCLQMHKKDWLKMSPWQHQLAKGTGAVSMEFIRERLWCKNIQEDILRYENAQKPKKFIQVPLSEKKNLLQYSNQDESKIF